MFVQHSETASRHGLGVTEQAAAFSIKHIILLLLSMYPKNLHDLLRLVQYHVFKHCALKRQQRVSIY